MPASHDAPPAPKRRRHDSSSPPFASRPSYNLGPLPRSGVPSHPNENVSPRFRSQNHIPPNTYRPTSSPDLRQPIPQKSPYQRLPPHSRSPPHSHWQNPQQHHSNITGDSNPNGPASTSSHALPPPLPPFSRVNVPELANLALPSPFPRIPSFAPSASGFSRPYLPLDALHSMPQSTSAQMQPQSTVNHQNAAGQGNGIQTSAVLPSVSPLVPTSPQSRSEMPRSDFGRQTQQASQGGRPNSNGITWPPVPDNLAPTIGSITPVAEALALLDDDSPIIKALMNVLTSQSNASLQAQSNHERLLNFRGFPPNCNPNPHALLVLSKIDLDILAWIFAVPKHGRKDDLARRILGSLQAPLRYRIPPQARRPASLRNITRAGTRAPAAMQQISAYRTQGSGASRLPVPRSNMPNLAPNPNSTSLRGDSLLQHLGRQLNPTANARQPSTLSQPYPNGPRARLSAADIRGRQVRDATCESLRGYSFKDGENPFNDPMNPPLGNSQNYTVFTSVHLSRGTSDPVLMFPTPSPIDFKKRPEIAGGDLQIHLRCLKIEPKKPKSEWKQSWPFPASCRVNGHTVILNQAQRYTNGKLAGIDTATNISPFLRKYKASTSENNRITLRRQTSTATPASGQFVLFAQEILVYTRETMIRNVHSGSERYWADHRRALEEKGIISCSTSKYEMARLGVVEFLRDPDGLTVSSMKVSLRCPLALTRITTPVKGKRCHHVQCFDLENFLEYSRRSSKFECPVCNKNTAYPSMLVISPYIEYALEKYTDCDEVEISQDGSMVPVERKQIGIASDDEEEDMSKSRTSGGTGSTHGGSKPAEVVDLTLDSDDDEPANMQPSNNTADHVMVDSSVPNMPIALEHASSGDQDIFSSGQEYHSDQNMIVQSNDHEQGATNDAAGLDQEIDFTFRSDFVPWEDTGPVSEDVGTMSLPMRIQPQTASNGNPRENWPIDVIAIDSD